ncbi:PTS transporter subunit EIIB [Romboutsia ilealis]
MGNNKVEKTNYKEIAQQIINEIGTSENLISAAYCATRLR